jgi:hypothetical protein
MSGIDEVKVKPACRARASMGNMKGLDKGQVLISNLGGMLMNSIFPRFVMVALDTKIGGNAKFQPISKKIAERALRQSG